MAALLFNKRKGEPMKVIKFYIFILSLFVFNTISAQSFLNLDFEVVEKGMPQRWIGSGDGFKIYVDTTVGFMSPKSLCIESVEKRVMVGTAASRFPVEAARGKTITFSGFIKTEKVNTGWACLWLVVFGKDADGKDIVLSSDDMRGRGAKFSEDWKKLIIKMKVDEKATGIAFGTRLVSNGKAWFDYLEFEIDGKIYEDVIPETKK
jgi:hypothetical protein